MSQLISVEQTKSMLLKSAENYASDPILDQYRRSLFDAGQSPDEQSPESNRQLPSQTG
jgi:hypothetical protein